MYEHQQPTEDEQPEPMEADATAPANGPAAEEGGDADKVSGDQVDEPKEEKESKPKKVKVKSIDLPVVSQVPDAMTDKDLATFRSIEASRLRPLVECPVVMRFILAATERLRSDGDGEGGREERSGGVRLRDAGQVVRAIQPVRHSIGKLTASRAIEQSAK